MKLAISLALVLTPLVVVADTVFSSRDGPSAWHFETQTGRADGSGTKRCQKFYMKKQENFSLKLDKEKSGHSRIKRFAQPQSGEWGSFNSNAGINPSYVPTDGPNNPQPGYIPPTSGSIPPTSGSVPPAGYTPPSGNPPAGYTPPSGGPPAGWTPPPAGYNPPAGWTPPAGQQTGKPNKDKDNNNGGQWNGPTSPTTGKTQRTPKCCVKLYTDDECKDYDTEHCVEDKSDDKRSIKGKASKEYRGFNILCMPESQRY